MRILLPALFGLLLVAAPADAWLIQGGVVDTGKQLLLGGSVGTVSTSADRYIAIGYSLNARTTATRTTVFPVAGSIRSLKFTGLTTWTGGGSYTATIEINGSATAATCTITSGTVCDWSGIIPVSAGDTGDILIHPVGSITGTSGVTAAVGFTPTTANDTMILSGAVLGTFSNSTTQVIKPFGGQAAQTNSNVINRQSIYPDGGTVDLLYISTNAPGTAGSGKSYAYTLLNNNSATALTTTVTDTATANSDLTHTATVAAGDFMQFQGVPSGSPTASNALWGVRYVPSTAAAYMYSTCMTSLSATLTEYAPLTDSGTAGITTEADAKGITYGQTFLKMYVKTSAAPGAGKQWNITLRKNGADTALTCSVADAATSCNATSSVAVNNNDLVNIAEAPINSPGGGIICVSLLATR